MSYITLDHLRPYLLAVASSAEQVLDQPFRFTGLDWLRFHSGAVDAASVLVKSRRTSALTRRTILLTETPTSIADSPIVADSLLVASDSSLSHLFQPNVDFICDPQSALLTIKPGGTLHPNQSITVWFEPYQLYREGTDYSLNAARGELRRLPSGAIADSESVTLDYLPLYAPFSDDLLNAAIAEANGLVESAIDPDRQFGTDSTLISAARSLALEIICRAAAVRELTSGKTGEKIALAWESLAATHAVRAEQLMNSFRPPMLSPKPPTIR